MKVLLLLVGIALLVSGTLMQDFRPPAAAEYTFNNITGQPDLSVLFEAFSMYARTGLILKLAGAGILFSLLIFRLLKTSSQLHGNLILPVILSLASATCFAVSSLTAYSARYMEWVWYVLGTRIPNNLSEAGSQQLRNSICELGNSATTGATFLAVSFFLLAAALVMHRRTSAASVSFPVLSFILFQMEGERRAVAEETVGFFSTMQWGGAFSITAFLLMIVISAAFFWTLAVPRKSSKKARILTISILIAAGLLAAAFRVVSVANLENLRPVLNFAEGALSPSVLAEALGMALSLSYFLALTLTVTFIFLPIMCAVALHSDKETHDTPRPGHMFLPTLVSFFLLIGVFGVAAVIGLSRNPFDESLRKVSAGISNDNPKDIQAEAALLDSEEGFAYMKSTAHNPHKFYWYQPVMDYLWRHSSAPDAKKFVVDSFFNETRPLLASFAAIAVASGFVKDESERNKTQNMILKHLSCNPAIGGSILEIALGNRDVRSDFILGILKTCHQSGLEKLKIHGEGRFPHYWEVPLDLRDGFTIHYRQESEPAANQVIVKLLWYKPDSYEPSTDPRKGRVVLEAGENRFRNIINEFGEIVPDYNRLIKFLDEKRTDFLRNGGSGIFIKVELQVNPLVPSYHVQYFLSTCARDGITEISIVEH